jgi:hypothetical protein
LIFTVPITLEALTDARDAWNATAPLEPLYLLLKRMWHSSLPLPPSLPYRSASWGCEAISREARRLEAEGTRGLHLTAWRELGCWRLEDMAAEDGTGSVLRCDPAGYDYKRDLVQLQTEALNCLYQLHRLLGNVGVVLIVAGFA